MALARRGRPRTVIAFALEVIKVDRILHRSPARRAGRRRLAHRVIRTGRSVLAAAQQRIAHDSVIAGHSDQDDEHDQRDDAPGGQSSGAHERQRGGRTGHLSGQPSGRNVDRRRRIIPVGLLVVDPAVLVAAIHVLLVKLRLRMILRAVQRDLLVGRVPGEEAGFSATGEKGYKYISN